MVLPSQHSPPFISHGFTCSAFTIKQEVHGEELMKTKQPKISMHTDKEPVC